MFLYNMFLYNLFLSTWYLFQRNGTLTQEDEARDACLSSVAGQMNEIAAFCNSYPSIDVKYDVKNKNKQATAVAYGDTITITVHVERDGDEDSDEEEGEAGTLFATWNH